MQETSLHLQQCVTSEFLTIWYTKLRSASASTLRPNPRKTNFAHKIFGSNPSVFCTRSCQVLPAYLDLQMYVKSRNHAKRPWLTPGMKTSSCQKIMKDRLETASTRDSQYLLQTYAQRKNPQKCRPDCGV